VGSPFVLLGLSKIGQQEERMDALRERMDIMGIWKLLKVTTEPRRAL
jgi:hypothetical protein